MQSKRVVNRRVHKALVSGTMLVASGFFISVPKTWGSVLVPGTGATVTPGTDTLSGLTLVGDEVVPFTGLDSLGNQVFAGKLESRVYSDPSTSGLDFAYQIVASAPEPDSIHTVAITNFATYSTDVDYVSGSGNVTYGGASRASSFNGFKLSFDYSANPNAIQPGDSTDWILVKTNAHAFDGLGTAAISDGGAANINIYEPVPEPTSLGVLVIGGAITLVRRRGARI